jgi:UDPglucose 6-dehydrogenase
LGVISVKIAVVGTGYVGLVVGTVFAEHGHEVTCIDKDPKRIEPLKKGKAPIYEPGLEELVQRNLEEDRLKFTTDLKEGIKDCLVIFLAVGTPDGPDGQADLSQVWAVAEAVGKALPGYRIIVQKSTCPVGTARRIEGIMKKLTKHDFDVVSNPEFLKEGSAVNDMMKPDRVVIGCDDVRVGELMKELYAPFLRTGNPLLMMSVESAELAKYASNTMLACRISLINELANLAEAYGADINEVRLAVGSDERIGPHFLFPGLGFGGSCFPKDVLAATHMSRAKGLEAPVLEGIWKTNNYQQERFIKRILESYNGKLKGKKIALWGLAFKPGTDDLRCAPALRVIDALLAAGAQVCAFDPVAGPGVKAKYGNKVDIAKKMYDPLTGADGLVICTEWREFRNPDFARMKKAMKQKKIFDGRNLYTPSVVADAGFKYASIGRPDA